MIPLPVSPNYPDVITSLHPCVVCGEHITQGNEAGYVHLGEGGSMILEKDEKSSSGFDEDGEGGMGWFPVGRGCSRKHFLGRFLRR